MLHADGWRAAGLAHRELQRRGLLPRDEQLVSQERHAFDYAGLQAQEAAERQAEAAAAAGEGKPEAERSQWVQDVLALHDDPAAAPSEAAEPEPRHDHEHGPEPSPEAPTADQVRTVLGITPARVLDGGTDALEHVRTAADTAQEKIDREATTLEPDAEDEDLAPSEAWPRETGQERPAVLHDPAPELEPAPEVIAAAAERDLKAGRLTRHCR